MELELITADDLYHKPLTHPEMLIDGILSTGLAILSGDSKIGKSWLVLWLCLRIAKGEPVWGIPTRKKDVVYLALEDRDWRIQDRMHQITEDPPSNLFIGFSCGVIGEELEMQIEETLREKPNVGIIFIDTFQMVRENVSAKLNLYAKDYQDLTSLKRIADEHGICIFLVHHTRKERDEANVFQNITGSTGIAGVADTLMVLQKENHYDNEAILSITGRDIEERVLHLKMVSAVWEVVGELNPALLRRKEVPDLIYRIAEYFVEEDHFYGTMTEFLKVLGESGMAPNVASRYLAKHYDSVLKPLGLRYESYRCTGGRFVGIDRIDDDHDGYDDSTGDDKQSSIDKRNTAYRAKLMTMKAGLDGQLSYPRKPSLSSLPSSESSEEDWKALDESTETAPYLA